MAQKTKRARKVKRNTATATTATATATRSRRHRQRQTQSDEPKSESHHYYSKMFFDGETMTTESQKDDEPVKRRKYTLKQLEREIPIGAELVKEYLDHKVPRGIEDPLPNRIEFKSVLPNPDDLGLMPPKTKTQTRKRHRRQDRENLRLVISDDNEDDDNDDNEDGTRRHKHPRNLFDLP